MNGKDDISLKVQVLMENTACREGICAEHGLSLYLETGRHRLLFDTGQSGRFADNTREMGVALAEAELAILSHGHYDHGGGLSAFLTENDHAPVYVSRHAFEKHGNAAGKEIGLAPELASDPRLFTRMPTIRSTTGWSSPPATSGNAASPSIRPASQ